MRQIQGTLNGIGERCGNANLVSIIPTLMLKPAFAERFETGIMPTGAAAGLTHVSRALRRDCSTARPTRRRPMSAQCAFATKAGIHASAHRSRSRRPTSTCRRRRSATARRVMVSDQAGKANLIAELERLGLDVDQGRHAARHAAARGQGARGGRAMPMKAPMPPSSFWRAARSARVPEFFRRRGFRVMVERRFDANGELKTVSEAMVKVTVDGETLHVGGRRQRPGQRARPRAAQGSRQVPALRSTISNSSTTRCVSSMAAPRPSTRVLIESRDGERQPLVHRRRLAEHRRRLLRGPDGFDRLQAHPQLCPRTVTSLQTGNFNRLGAEEQSMCNLYSIRRPRDEVVGLFGISHVDDGVQLELPAVYPDTMAPVIALDHNGARNLTMMCWGFPPPPTAKPRPVTNIRNVKSSYWRNWLKPEFRCLVPATSFCEWTDKRPKIPHWFALDDMRPAFAFAGLWRLLARRAPGGDGRPPPVRISHHRGERPRATRSCQGHAGHAVRS